MDFFTPEANSVGAFPRVRTGRTKIRIKNMLLVMGPGRGLAEAGGSHGSYWKAGRDIEEAKARVVDLIYRRISAPFPDVATRTAMSL